MSRALKRNRRRSRSDGGYLFAHEGYTKTTPSTKISPLCNGAALKRSPPDYVTAEAYYRLGYESRDIKLEEIAKGLANVTSGEYVDGSMELFEDEAWMHDMLQNAFEGTGIFEDMDDLRRATVCD